MPVAAASTTDRGALAALLSTRRSELLALVGGTLAIVLLAILGTQQDNAPPGGIYLRGLITASVLSLHAIGLVLAYRSNRFLNFAQVQIGALGGTLFALLVQAQPLLRLVAGICPPCVTSVTPAFFTVMYVVAVAAGLGFSVLVSRLFYTAVVRRFAESSPLVATVASIFVIQFLAGLRDPIVGWLTTDEQQAVGIPGGPLPPPISLNFQVLGAPFSLVDIITVVIAVVAFALLGLFLHGTAAGTAIRAAAGNRERAQTLGIDVGAVVGRVWTAVGFLSGAAALIAVMGAGEASVSGGLNVTVLVRILAVVVVARLVSLPWAAAGALVFGILAEVSEWVLRSAQPFEGALVVIIGLLLLAQNRERRRADDTDIGSWRTNRELRPLPQALRALPQMRRNRRIAFGLLAILALGTPWIMSPAQTSLITNALIFAIAGLSLLVLTGWAGLVSLGQFAFAAVGAYVAAVTGLPPLLAIPVGGIAGALVAAAVGFPALRLRGLYLAVTTLAFALAVQAILLSPTYLGRFLPQDVNRPSLLGMDLDDQRVAYYLMLVLLTLSVVVVMGLRRSRTGRVLIAARDNEAAVRLVGVSVARARLTAFALSGFLAAVAGVLASYQQGGVRPESFSPETSVQIFVFAVVGGFGNVAATLLGFLYFALVSLVSSQPTVLELASGIGGLALLLSAPGGLGEVAVRLRDTVARRVAKRHRIPVPTLYGGDDVLDARAPLREKTGRGGATEFIPRRYGLLGQWAVAPDDHVADRGPEVVIVSTEGKEPVDV